VPKQLEEINIFNSGTYYAPDKRDIPNSAASFSKNIDPLLDNGALKGIPANTTHKTGVDSVGMSLINDNGTIRAVYMDSDGDFYKIDDLEGSPGTPTLLESGTFTSNPAMEVNNKEVHIGQGTSLDVKWVGIVTHGQFDGSAPSGVQIENASLNSPSSFTDMHKIVTDDTYIYSIEYSGQSLYRFKISDGTIDKIGKPIFKNQADLTALALASDGDLWLLDSKTFHQGNNIVGVLYKVDSTTLEVIQENKLTLASNTAPNKYTDLLEIGAELWISAEKTSLVSGGANTVEKAYITNVTIPTEDGDTVITNRMPIFRVVHSATPTAGKFDTHGTTDGATMNATIPRVNLIKLKDSTNHCGLAMDIRDPSGSELAQFAISGSTTKEISSCIVAVHKSCDSTSDPITGDNYLFYFADSTGSITPKQIFSDGTTNRGYVTSDGSNYIAVSQPSNSDSLDDSYIWRVAIPDMDTATNGDILQTYQLSINSNITNSTVCFADGGSSTIDFHLFSSGDSVGRWSKLDDVASSYSSKDATVILQSDANVSLSLASSGASSSFTAEKNYFYKISYVYDGYQESPLSSDFMITQGGTSTQVSVSVDLFNTASISKRITGINLYMAEGDANSSDPTGFYRIVKAIDINDQWVQVSDDATSPDWGVKKSHQFMHNGTSQGSYESRTGISEALDNFTPKYKLSTILNNQLFVTKCSHPEIEDANLYIFKSRPYNYDQFNWVFDFMVLPDIPTAIKGFNGRLYAFTKSKIYRIEPNGMYIEDVFDGAGCLSSKSVIVTDYGMFFADNNNIYFHDGRSPKPIAGPIITQPEVTSPASTGDPYPIALYTAWQLRPSPQRDVVLGFDNKRRALLVFFDIQYNLGLGDVNYNYCWAYSIDSNRWDLWDSEAVTSYVSGTSGENFISNGTNLFNYLGHASTKVAWQWYSKKLVMNASTVNKKFIKLHEQSDSGTPAVTVAFDSDPTSYSALSSITKAKWARIKVVSNATTDRLNALGMQWRGLREVPVTDP
jgi:hypothetical protein